MRKQRNGFDAFVVALDRFLAHYPENTIACSDAPNADKGARFTFALRQARAVIGDYAPRTRKRTS